MPDHAPSSIAGGEARSVRLVDGRRLAYLDLGDPAGYPVISCHGGLSSRLDVAPTAEAAAAHGLRLISPDRPGVGRSDRQPDRLLVDWPVDVAALADDLELPSFAVMGWSLGGCYAQAVARCLADRVRVVALVASGIPATWDGMVDGLHPMDRLFLRLCERGAPIERTLFDIMRLSARRAPRALTRSIPVSADDAVAIAAAVAEGLIDTKGVVEDYRVMKAPWGFEPSEITVPVQIWQGDADDLVPPLWGRWLADAIPGATLTIVPGATHYLWYDHWDEILDGLISAGAAD